MLRNLTRKAGDEEGQAMLLVIAVILITTLLVVGIFAQAIQQFPIARHDQDYQSALAAAEAGVDDFVNRLDQNQNYWNYSSSNPPPDGNTAFSAWTQVPTPPGPSAGASFYRYTPDTSQLSKSGTLYLNASGKANNVFRSVRVGLRRQSFLDYLYSTDYETLDPALSSNPGSPGPPATGAWGACHYYAYQTNPTTGQNGPNYGSPLCTRIVFGPNDVLNGPVDSNDALQIYGQGAGGSNPTFRQSVKTTDPLTHSPGGPGWIDVSGNSTPNFQQGIQNNAPRLVEPPTDSYIQGYTLIGQPNMGCLYTGPTTIVLNSNGTMTVTSPETKATNNAGGPGGEDCAGSTLPSAAPVTVPLPPNGVIYVQNVPTCSGAKPDPNCSNTCSTFANPISGPGHSGCSGDAIVQGVLNGQLTIATDNDVVIVGNLTYNGGLGGNDVLGLLSNEYIQVNHPLNNSGNANATYNGRQTASPGNCPSPTNATTDLCNLTIDAAMLALQHSFIVPNWAVGAGLGNLNINGAIGQEYRGPVGTVGASGYVKNYVYDPRLAYLSPPFMLNPVEAAWERVSFAELNPLYSS